MSFCMIMSQIVYAFYISSYLDCSLLFAISNNVVLNILCVSPAHARVQEFLQGSGFEDFSCISELLPDLLN